MSDLIDRQDLLRRKARIEALLPLVRPERAFHMRLALDRINQQLGTTSGVDPAALVRDPLSVSGLNGIGALEFQAQSPPGIGRLVKLPMYPIRVPAQGASPVPFVWTANGAHQPSARNPMVIAYVGVGAGGAGPANAVSGFFFQSPQIEWARLRLVGFETSFRVHEFPIPVLLDPPAFIYIASFSRSIPLVKNLSVGGGTNLFADEDYQDGTVFSTFCPEYPGLRDNPVVVSPNQISVEVAFSGQIFSGINFSCACLVEILDDTSFGAHIPGPYARKDALARRPDPQGNVFVE